MAQRRSPLAGAAAVLVGGAAQPADLQLLAPLGQQRLGGHHCGRERGRVCSLHLRGAGCGQHACKLVREARSRPCGCTWHKRRRSSRASRASPMARWIRRLSIRPARNAAHCSVLPRPCRQEGGGGAAAAETAERLPVAARPGELDPNYVRLSPARLQISHGGSKQPRRPTMSSARMPPRRRRYRLHSQRTPSTW